jgi:hypothetical protein
MCSFAKQSATYKGRELPRAPRIDPYEPNSGIRLLWGFLCQGGITSFWSSFVIPFFCSTLAASILPSQPYIFIAVARSGGQRTALLQRCRTRARRQTAGDRVVGRAMIRGEPAIGRDQSREPRLYSVEPVWGPDHEAVIRFCGQGSEAAGPFSQRHCSHSRMRIAATSDRHRLPSASSAVRCRTLFVLSRSRVLLTPPVAARHRPAPRRS